MFKRIDHVALVPGNIKTSLNFYQNILGFKIKKEVKPKSPMINEIVFLSLGDATLELVGAVNPAMKSNENWQIGLRGIALEVENMDETVAYLKEKKVALVGETMDTGFSLRGEIRDPDGLVIELIQPHKT